MTLEQMRAADAWRCSEGCSKDYVNLAKGLPALIMNSGLMQVMAYLNEKGGKSNDVHATIGEQLRAWLVSRSEIWGRPGKALSFDAFMQGLMKADPREFQLLTSEALHWLRWLRQIAPARLREND